MFNKCHREWLCNDFFGKLQAETAAPENKEEELKKLFRKQFKILDYCRALHAEENAIINLARNGSAASWDKCTLYTTTYPCRMCANKIVMLGIKEMVYAEPYPDSAAKIILDHANIYQRFFKGVTFKAYSRLYGEEK